MQRTWYIWKRFDIVCYMCMSQDRNNILCEERNMGKFRSNIPEYCCINNKNVLCNPQKAPSQLTSGIPSLFEFVATGGLRILGVIVRMPKKVTEWGIHVLTKKNYHNNIDTDLDFRGKSIKDVWYFDLVFRILHAHLRLNYIYFSLALTVLNEFNVPP